MLDDLFTWLVVSEGALLALVLLFAVVSLTSTRGRLTFLLLTILALLTARLVVLVRCNLYLTKGSCGRNTNFLALEWLLKGVSVRRVLSCYLV